MPGQKQSKRSRQGGVVPAPPRGKVSAIASQPPRSRAAARRASPKVLLIAGGAIVAVTIVGVLAVSVSGRVSGAAGVPAVGSLTGALPGAAHVRRLFEGIPQDGDVLGSPRAPVTLVEYADLQCPYCREFEANVLPSLVRDYVRTGKLRIEQRLLAFLGPDSVTGRSAVLAAGLQGRQYDLTALLYYNQGTENTGWLDGATIEKAAASIPGLDVPTSLTEAKAGTIEMKETDLDRQAKADGVSSTPTILVGRTGTVPRKVALASPSDLAAVETVIREAAAPAGGG